MDERQIKQLRLMILMFLLVGALLFLAIRVRASETILHDPANNRSELINKTTPTAKPGDKPKPTKKPKVTATPGLTQEAKATPTPTNTADLTAEPTPYAGLTPTAGEAVAGAESSPSPSLTEAAATSAANPTEAVTAKPTATSTPKPTATSAPKPTATSTPKPTATSTPKPTATSTPKPTATPTPIPTATPLPTASGTASSENYYGALKVVGPQLCDSEGKAVQLRGMSTHGLSWFPQYVNYDAFAQLKDWGCNVVRLAMYTHEGGYCNGADKNQLKKLIKDGVSYASMLDMYVIIDWHVLNEHYPSTYLKEAKEFFAEMSELYADNPHVIYEICNEPNSGPSWQDVKAYANEVIPVIRANSPDSIIIVGTTTWSQDVDQAAASPLTGYDNIMYSLHFYAATHKEDLRNRCKKAYEAGLPIFVSEFGICDASGNGAIDEKQADEWITLLNRLGISYVNWSLCNKAESASFLNSNCQKLSGWTNADLSKSGKWMVKTLGNSGNITPTSAAATPAPKPNPPTPGPNPPAPGPKPGPAATPTATPIPATPTATPTATSTPTPTATPTPTNTPSPTPDIKLSDLMLEKSENLKIDEAGAWSDGESTTLYLKLFAENTGEQEENDWVRYIKLKEGSRAEIASSWCAIFTLTDGLIEIRPFEWNKTIAPAGSSAEIGLQLKIYW